MANEEKNKEVVTEENVKNQTEQEKAEETKEAKTENTSENNQETEKVAEKESDKKKKATKKKKNTKADELEKKDKEIEELRYKMSEINDKYMRLTAEFDNYRKRTLKEKTELIKTAGGEVLADMLPVIDDFERGLQSMDTAEDVTAVKEGVQLIYTKFKEFMKGKGIVEIEAVNQDFDTDYHEALTKIPAPEEKLKGKVVDVIQKGYKIGEKVIRFAKVVIGE